MYIIIFHIIHVQLLLKRNINARTHHFRFQMCGASARPNIFYHRSFHRFFESTKYWTVCDRTITENANDSSPTFVVLALHIQNRIENIHALECTWASSLNCIKFNHKFVCMSIWFTGRKTNSKIHVEWYGQSVGVWLHVCIKWYIQQSLCRFQNKLFDINTYLSKHI